jgi:hypothetical protein
MREATRAALLKLPNMPNGRWSNFRPPLNLQRPSLTHAALAGTPAPSRKVTKRIVVAHSTR